MASRVLCFGFVLKTVLRTLGCFSYCWREFTQSQGIFCLSHHPASKEAVDRQESGRGQRQDTWPQLTKGSFHNIWRHAQHIRWWEKDEGGKMIFRVMAFVFSSDHYMWWNSAFPGMAEHQPANGKQWLNFLFCFACMCSFCFSVFISAHEFFHLCSFYPLPHPTMEAVWCFVVHGVKPQHLLTWESFQGMKKVKPNSYSNYLACSYVWFLKCFNRLFLSFIL